MKYLMGTENVGVLAFKEWQLAEHQAKTQWFLLLRLSEL